MSIYLKAKYLIGKDLSAMQSKQIPYATSRAINDTAYALRPDVQDYLSRTLNNPSAWFKRSFLVLSRSTKTNLSAQVGFQKTTAIAEVLASGGKRHQKAYERELIKIGALPVGYFAVPYLTSKLSPSIARSILKALSGQTVKKQKNTSKYFVLPKIGVFLRDGHQILPVLLFVSHAQYKKWTEIATEVQKAYEKYFNPFFQKYIQEASA